MLAKGDLLRLLAGKNRGIAASETEKQAILAAIAQLESYNPNPNPFNATALLDGNWRLLYTTSRELLGINNLPLFKLGEVYQCIRIKDNKIYNIAEVSGLPFLEGIISVAAGFEPTSERRVSVKFERAITGLQRLIGYQSPNQFIQQIEAGKKFAAIDFQLKSRQNVQSDGIEANRRGWLDITYLDETLRIGRGNEGSVFVLDLCR
jgi:PAP_fibrillin